MKEFIIVAFLLISCFFGFSQTGYYSEENKKSIKQIELMIGDWSGSGWLMNKETRERETFEQTERIRFALDSTIIIVEGKGVSNESIVHDALAIISTNPNGGFFMTSFLGDGREGKYEMKGEDGKYEWKIPTAQGNIVYNMMITEKTWREVGVFEINGERFPFFEMNLSKIKK